MGPPSSSARRMQKTRAKQDLQNVLGAHSHLDAGQQADLLHSLADEIGGTAVGSSRFRGDDGEKFPECDFEMRRALCCGTYRIGDTFSVEYDHSSDDDGGDDDDDDGPVAEVGVAMDCLRPVCTDGDDDAKPLRYETNDPVHDHDDSSSKPRRFKVDDQVYVRIGSGWVRAHITVVDATHGRDYMLPACAARTCTCCPTLDSVFHHCPHLYKGRISYATSVDVNELDAHDKPSKRKDFVDREDVEMQEFMNEFNEFISSDECFPHHETAKSQNHAFDHATNTLQRGHCVGVGDFSQNWSNEGLWCTQQEYFRTASGTVFPMVLTLHTADLNKGVFADTAKENTQYLETHPKLKGLCRVTLAFISDDRLHDKGFVAHVVDLALRWIRANTKIDNFAMFSDGCRAQFKNKDSFGANGEVLFKFPWLKSFAWHFFCSCHGKGLVRTAIARTRVAIVVFQLVSTKFNVRAAHAHCVRRGCM